MAVKNGIGYSPLTDKVYLGKQNTEKRLWVGDKKDITNEFLAVASEFFLKKILFVILVAQMVHQTCLSISKMIRQVLKRLLRI
jgi:hypothetical protein